MSRVLSLDIDGVLTTEASRGRDYWCFGVDATEAFRCLLQEAQLDLCLVHSSWRKLPEEPHPVALDDTWWMYGDGGYPTWSHDLWRSICHRQGIEWTVPLLDAPFQLGTDRGIEVGMWVCDHLRAEDRLVALDDEAHLLHAQPWSRQPNVLVLQTDDHTGLTQSQAQKAIDFLRAV